MRLSDKVAIVTGAGSGIGRATVLEFARQGAKVVAADVNLGSAEETVSLAKGEGGDVAGVYVDVSSFESVHQLVSKTLDLHGQLDIMFNNAGVSSAQPYPLLDVPLEDYHRVVSVNQHGVFFGIQAAAAVMKGSGGVIINTASIYAYIADRGSIAYHASKAAVLGLTRAAALELAPYNIRVVGIAPGLIDTGIVAKWKEQPDLWRKIERAQMRKKAGQPEEVARVVAFLASEDASFMNGHVYNVDDGSSAFKR